MNRATLHLQIRQALGAADELSRVEHRRGNDEMSARLAVLRTALSDLEREIGRSHTSVTAPSADVAGEFERAFQWLRVHKRDVPRSLFASTERVSQGLSGAEPPHYMQSALFRACVAVGVLLAIGGLGAIYLRSKA